MRRRTSSPWQHLILLLLLLLLVPPSPLPPVGAQADIPCSLSTGTSRESFTANELLPVGSVIGVLNINGDPSPENGTIELRLSQDDAGVEIVAGTKNLTLVKQLDKEGITGLAEVSLQVYCRKRDSTELSFPIPLRVYVSDANDNGPVFVYVPTKLDVSEMTQPGTVVTPQPIRAVDADQTGPYSTVQYSLVPSDYSHHFIFTNALKGILALKSRLDYETVPNFNITVRAQDLGNPPMTAVTTIAVTVLDADDLNPKFADERYTAVLPEEPQVGLVLDVRPRPIKAQDMDRGLDVPIEYSFKSDKVDGKYFNINRTSGVIYLRRPLLDDVVYPLTLVIKASQVDNRERVALTTLTVSEKNTFLTGLRFLQKHYIGTVPENLPLNQTVLTVPTNKLDDKRLRFTLMNNTDGTFNITNKGEVVLNRHLDYEKTRHYSLHVNVTDGKLADSAWVNLSVVDVNNHAPLFGSQLYNFVLMDGILYPGMTLGHVDATDGDSGDKITFHLVGDRASDFGIDETGSIRVLNVTQLNSSLSHLLVVATDSGDPPRQASVPVIITIPDDVRLSAARSFTAESSFLLMIVFGAMLGILILIIIILALYIAKNRHSDDESGFCRPSSQSLSKVASYMTRDIPHQKLLRGSPPSDPRGQVGMDNPIFTEDSESGTTAMTASITSKDDRPPSSLTLSTSTSPRMSPRASPGCSNRRFAPRSAPPPLPKTEPPRTTTNNHNNQQHHLVQDSPRGGNKGKAPLVPPLVPGKQQGGHSGCKATHKGSIPRRIKKLSWEDEKLSKVSSVEL